MKSKKNSTVGMNIQKCVLSSGAFVVLALSFVAQGCSSESNGTPGTGGAAAGTGGASTGTGGAASGSGGASTGTGGASAGTGGAATGTGGETTGTGGASTGTGGSSTGTGGAATGTGGASTGSGGAGAGGTTAAPLCGTQTKGSACATPTDVCAKNCGPKTADNVSIGSKTLTCTSDVYVEGACTFPAGDLTCFKVSATTAACPAGTSSSGACTATSCMPCSGYTDSAGAAKVGYCHCVNSKWSCGSTKEWPCTVGGTSTSPGGTGC